MTDDTVNTLTTESMLTTLTWLTCISCGGEKEINIEASVDEGNFFHLGTHRCPSCQDPSGTATGLMLSGLSEECFCLEAASTPCDGCLEHIQENRFGNWHRSEWCDCQGRNRIPRRHDVLDAMLEALLKELKCGIDIQPRVQGGYGISLSIGTNFYATGNTLQEVAIAALYGALVAKGLVE